MKKEEVIEFREKILALSIVELRDRYLVVELTKLFTSMGDIFTTIRLPNSTHTLSEDIFSHSRYNRNKELSRKIGSYTIKKGNDKEVKNETRKYKI